jgi:hypothetical protein
LAHRLPPFATLDRSGFTVQDEIAASVTAVIEPALAAAEQERVLRKPPERLDAWETISVAFGTSTNTDRTRTKPR